MQMIDFLRNIFTKNLEIQSSFLSYFSDFFKNLKFQKFQKIDFSKLSNFKFEKR
jgi:hypothetical protein